MLNTGDSTPQCPVCYSPNVGRSRSHHTWGAQSYDLYLCDECGLGFWYPLIMPAKLFYEAEAESVSVPVRTRHTLGSQRLGDNHQMFLKNHPGGGQKLLDIGCGDGHFIEEAQKRGFQVSGIDFDRKALAVAQKRGIENLYYGSLDDILKNNALANGFDIVTFFEVFEHQAAPLTFMANVTKMLKPGGWIAGSVPNVKRFKSSAANDSDRPPYHFTQWSKISLMAMLNMLGFKEISVLSIGTGYYVLSLINGLNLSVKEQLLQGVDPFTLTAVPVELAAQQAGVTGNKLSTIKGLRKLKSAAFAPLVAVEMFVERIWDKGQFLYFEGRL